MRYLTLIAVCVALNVSYARLAVADEQPEAGSTAGAQAAPGDELHFVSVLTFQGEIAAIDPAKRLLTVKSASGTVLTLEARSEEELATHKTGERVLVQYVEGARVRKRGSSGVVEVQSLKDGLTGAEPGEAPGKQRVLAASVERIDALNQEITLKGADGSLETIMVSNPEYLSNLKVGDRVVIARPQGLALSLEGES